MKGYGGRTLFVDCTTAASRVEPLSERAARALLGGNGLAARILYDHVPSGIDAFDPANAVVFAVGPITDTTVPGNSRACAAAKSPLTGLFFDSTFGGRFPATLKRTGFDAVVLTGRAPAPSYVVVDERGATLKPAAAAWGRTTRDAVAMLVEAEGPEADAIAIGQAGERKVRFAAMAHYWKNREAVSGRGGLGAVLGSKNVKALVVKGARKTEIAEPAALKALLEETREPLKKGTQALTTFGTPFLVGPINALGALGSYNLRTEVFAQARVIGGESMKEHYHDRDTTCLKCPVACGKQYAIREGEFAGTHAKMPEYESIFALGPMLGIAEPEALILANDLCDLHGLDTISMGVTLALVCEALERGWLAPGRVDPSRGDAPGLRGQAARATGALRARAQGPVHWLRHRHPRRQPSRHAAHAAVRADVRPPLHRRQAGVCRAQPALHRRRRLAGDVSLHVRARLRAVRRRALRPRGAGRHRLGHGCRGAGEDRRAHRQPRTSLQRPRGRAPRPGRAAVEGDARADPRGPLGRHVLPTRRARRDARRLLRSARLGRGRRSDARPPVRARSLSRLETAHSQMLAQPGPYCFFVQRALG